MSYKFKIGDLTAARVTSGRFLAFAALLYLGAQSNKNICVCVFFCFVTQAVHLKMIVDLASDSSIATLMRFISRKSLSSDIYCDNGANYFSAKICYRLYINFEIPTKP